MKSGLVAADRQEIAAFLGRTAPFADASAADRDSLAAATQLWRFAPGMTLFQEGDASAATWIVHTGRVRILNFVAGLRTVQIERFGPRQLIGVCCRLGGRLSYYQCTAVADGPTTAVRLPDASFYALLGRSSAVERAACELCSRRLRGMRRMVGETRQGVRARVARVLLELRGAHGDTVRATRHALAGLVGAAPETVFRVLAEFRRAGVLTTGRGVVHLLDTAALARELSSREAE